MSKRIGILFLICVFSTSLIWGLYMLSYEVNRDPNNFIRLFPPHRLSSALKMNLNYNTDQIAGIDSEKVVLSIPDVMDRLLLVQLDKGNIRKVKIDGIEEMKKSIVSTVFTSPFFYVVRDDVKQIYRGDTIEWRAKPFSKIDLSYDTFIPLPDSSFVLRTITAKEGYVLVKKDKAGTIKKAPALLEKQVDGLFCRDGILHYNQKLGLLVYLYYYRNQFIVADKNLNLLYKGKTIDTVSRAKIKIGLPDQDGHIKLAEPPIVVNKKSCVSAEYLFVQSNLKADNEDAEQFKNAWVVDVYELKNGKYKLSFYLPKTKTGKIKDMKVTGKTMAVLYAHRLCTYKLNF
ncbi:hypothetical protein [Pedobacter heparinus]|uniref:hypothetical protein n=1 Tax=Pedobacter heparinus TaxID=984 RepID=UPI002931AB81|nr:hypothetical protein [Pedobacter heparinus]